MTSVRPGGADFAVVGGGIVGLAAALYLVQRRPGADVVVIEKEARVATHQTSHNSGVIHTGIYYPPDSFKARLCRAGADATRIFAREHGIPFNCCGKLIVATTARELVRLNELYERARQNSVAVDRLDGTQLRELEPNIVALAALRVSSAAVIDFARVAGAMAGVVESLGGELLLGAEVTSITELPSHVEIVAGGKAIRVQQLVVCGGLQSDRLARLAGLPIDYRIVPIRGECFRLPPARNDFVHSMIYPVPDPELPFLGVHLTPGVDRGITVGPNAVLGLSREGYEKWSINRRDVKELAAFPGMWRLAKHNVRTGARELRNSIFRRGYLRECRRYAPHLTLADLQPTVAGIRAQAVRRDGSLVHDFLFTRTGRMLHVGNAPSPAATAALPIGGMIADTLFGKPSASLTG